LSIDDVSVNEGNAGTAELTFTVTLSAASEELVTVAYATEDTTATAGGLLDVGGSDYDAASGTLKFKPGETERTLTITVNGDLLNEADETLMVSLSKPVGGKIEDGEGEGIIVNEDDSPLASIEGATAAEGNSGTSLVELTVALSTPSGQSVTVDWTTVDDAAEAGEDYAMGEGTVTFEPGETTQTIQVTITGDTVDETDEAFDVELANPVNVDLAAATAAVTITDDDTAPSLAIGNASIAEGNAGTTDATLTVNLSAPSGYTVTVDYASEDATASEGEDYAASTGTLTFAPGETSKMVPVALTGDADAEFDETLTVSLSNPSHATIATADGTLGILNDDGAFAGISIDDVSVSEGNASTSVATFTVTLSEAVADDVTIDYATSGGTATEAGAAPSGGLDFVATSGSLTFLAGEVTKTIEVTINGDVVYELDEGFTVDLSNAVNGGIVDAQGAGSITNDDVEPEISLGDTAVAEGAAGTRAASFVVTLSAPSGLDTSVDFATSDGTAIAPDDYSSATGTLLIPAGDTFALILVSVQGDLSNEDADTILLDLTNPVNASIADDQGTGTITNDDPLPQIVIGDVSVSEGDSATRLANFTVTLSAPSGRDVSVDWATANGAAIAGQDYVAASGTLEFPVGTDVQVISVTVNGDNQDELNEDFVVDLSTAVNASILDDQATATITNDDSIAPALNINDASVAEGDSGTAALSLTVTLETASAQTVTVGWSAADGTADDGLDYTVASGTVTFDPGDTMKTIEIDVLGDVLHEPDETLVVTLADAVNAFIADGSGEGTITDDDTAPELSITDIAADEGDAETSDLSFTVSLSAPSAFEISVAYATADGTATEAGSASIGDDDYESTSDLLVFAPGETTKNILVAVNGDDVHEPTENFVVTLSTPTNATILDADGTGTITNDEALPAASVDDIGAIEGDNGSSKQMIFTVTLSRPSSVQVSVDYATADDSASDSSDYDATGGTVTFEPGETEQTFAVTINGDNANEANETYFVDLSNGNGVTVGDGQGVGTITADDGN
jgi:chitinase